MDTVISSPEGKLLSRLKDEFDNGEVRLSEGSSIFREINQSFPFIGSSINWAKVPNSVDEKADAEDYFPSATSFIERITARMGFNDSDTIIVVGDSAMELALSLSLGTFKGHLEDFLIMPQHTYIVSPDVSWCACFRMEGNMSFGFRPVR